MALIEDEICTICKNKFSWVKKVDPWKPIICANCKRHGKQAEQELLREEAKKLVQEKTTSPAFALELHRKIELDVLRDQFHGKLSKNGDLDLVYWREVVKRLKG